MKEKDLIEFADELLKPIKNYKTFSNSVSRNQLTPIGKVKVDVFYAYAHLTNNTYSQNRFKFIGGFSETLKNPLFIFKGKYEHDGKMVDSYCYYKPFLKNGELIHLFNRIIDKNGKFYQKTYYNSTNGFKKIEKMFDNEELVYNHPKIDKKLFETELLGNNSRGVVDEIISNCLKNVNINNKELENSNALEKIVKNYEDSVLTATPNEDINYKNKNKARSRERC